MVAPIQLSNETPEVIRQQIDFAYRLYRPVDLNATTATANGVPDEFSTELQGLHSDHPIFGILNNKFGPAVDGLSSLGQSIGDGFGSAFGGMISATKEAYAHNGRLLDLTLTTGIMP
jgi:hypothetical protein